MGWKVEVDEVVKIIFPNQEIGNKSSTTKEEKSYCNSETS
jgi:hypothetical protein